MRKSAAGCGGGLVHLCVGSADGDGRAAGRADACRVDRPAGLWPTDYVDIGTGPWDTHLHHGLNSNFNKHMRPIGTKRAVMIFVDFSDRPSTSAPANQGGRDWREPQSYADWLAPGLDFFKTRVQRPLRPRQIDVIPKWFRMDNPRPTRSTG